MIAYGKQVPEIKLGSMELFSEERLKNFWKELLMAGVVLTRLVENEKHGFWRPEVKIGATWL